MAPISRRTFLFAVAATAAGWKRWVPAPEAYALVLGSVQDGGLPQAGCYTARCDRARSEPRYVASLALVEPEAQRFYLVDATPDLTRQIDLIAEDGFRRRAQARRPFDGIFLTHAHIGHYLGLALLGREGLGIAPTPCYCSPDMAEFLSNNGPWSLLVEEGRLYFPELSFDRWNRIDDMLSVQPISVPHRHEFSDTVGFIFRGPTQSLLYLPDIDSWDAWDRRVEFVVTQVAVALLDGSFYSVDEVPGRSYADVPHPVITDTMNRLELAVRAGSRVVFTHLNNTNVALDAESAEAQDLRRRGFEVAKAGMRFTL